MTTRVLPPEEWPRLAGTEMGTIWAKLPSDGLAVVVVVEDDAGQIVGCWSALTVIHLEGLWIDPAHRKKTAVPRRLLGTMRRELLQRGIQGALTHAITPDVEQLLRHVGASVLEGQSYYLPLTRGN